MTPRFSATAFLLLACTWGPVAFAQDQGIHPPVYRGVRTVVDGVFVTPVPNAALSAVVTIESTKTLPDGTSDTQHSLANIARDSRGRVYNEQRDLLPDSVKETPELISALIFDPETRLSTLLNPFTHIARQRTLPPRPPQAAIPNTPVNTPTFKREDLGPDMMENVSVRGTRQTRTVPAATSGTGKDVVTVDETWYSDELHMNMLTKHSDERSGVQVVTVTQVNRAEPESAIFEVPAGYKVVDVNPPK